MCKTACKVWVVMVCCDAPPVMYFHRTGMCVWWGGEGGCQSMPGPVDRVCGDVGELGVSGWEQMNVVVKTGAISGSVTGCLSSR